MLGLFLLISCAPEIHEVDNLLLEDHLGVSCKESFFEMISGEDRNYSERAIFMTATDPSLDTSGDSGWLEVNEGIEISGTLMLRVDDYDLHFDTEGVFEGNESSFDDPLFFSFSLGHTWCEDGTLIAATSTSMSSDDLIFVGSLREGEEEETWDYYGDAPIWAQVMDLTILRGSFDGTLSPSGLIEELETIAHGTMNRAW
jgi:hypothetical protein